MGARFRLTAGALAVATALCLGAAAGRVVGPIGDLAPAPGPLLPARSTGATPAPELGQPDPAGGHGAHAGVVHAAPFTLHVPPPPPPSPPSTP